jgi:hypothetical protein
MREAGWEEFTDVLAIFRTELTAMRWHLMLAD